MVSAATFIGSFVVTVMGFFVITSRTSPPSILLAVSESHSRLSASPSMTRVPLSSRGRKSNVLTNPTSRSVALRSGCSASRRRSTTGAPDTPARRRAAMASSTGVCGVRTRRWGWEVMRSDTILFVGLDGVETKTRC